MKAYNRRTTLEKNEIDDESVYIPGHMLMYTCFKIIISVFYRGHKY